MFQTIVGRPTRNLFTLLLLALLVAGAAAGVALGYFQPSNGISASSIVAIDLSSSSLTVKEGGTASYTVKLNAEPYADVTVALSLTSLGIVTADKYSLTFTSTTTPPPRR